MLDYTETSLWKRAFSADVAPPGIACRRLRSAFEGARERAGHIAADIARDLPDFTVHDVTHLDALWEMAEVLAGPEYPMNPAEAFVFGCAILVHDLGMGLAAYPGREDQLRATQLWRDALGIALRRHLGRSPVESEIENPPAEAVRIAISTALRLGHAEQATSLLTKPWRYPDREEQEFLIGDSELRRSLGMLAGKIAESHWWPIERVRREFSVVLGALSWCPKDWQIDPLKIAGLLRVADASHVDARRAPFFLRTVRNVGGVAKSHWQFQERLSKPFVDAHRLIYTSTQPFPIELSNSWWLCFDTLSMINAELRSVDSMFLDERRPQLAARSVAGVDSLSTLRRYVPTDDWVPVDTRVRVSDVAAIIENLGGSVLYGWDATVPLRELVQNASDAVGVRRVLEQRPDEWGEVEVTLGTENGEDIIAVRDNGIGMSEAVLSGPLLDFGLSYWTSELMQQEHPGLPSSTFEPGGRFGVGFFSVFMWGKRVKIVTRRPSDSVQDTRVLELQDGATARPLLRRALPIERLREPGTVVQVWLESQMKSVVQRWAERKSPQFIRKTLQDICVGTGADIFVQCSGGRELAVPVNWWQTASAHELLDRVGGIIAQGPLMSVYGLRPERLKLLSASLLSEMRDSSGRLVGRAAIFPGLRYSSRNDGEDVEVPGGLAIAAGMRAQPIMGLAGVIVGRPSRVTRDAALPVLESKSLSAWASEQARVFSRASAVPDEILLFAANHINAWGGDCGDLPIARGSKGWLSKRAISSWENPPKRIVLFEGKSFGKSFGKSSSLPDDVLETSIWGPVWPTSANPSGTAEAPFPAGVSFAKLLQKPLDDKDVTWVQIAYGPARADRFATHAELVKANWVVVVESLINAWGARAEDVTVHGEFSREKNESRRKGAGSSFVLTIQWSP